ncbi:ATP-binding protein [uncultured Xanthomonas sp.]|uniref:ATP-binding protein n=1 Tax=uncultured Xanthomonas sp. TaxID=152831 RepID=UPI0025D2BE48|nr:ATP-binding protein [uncultured Xanthomonas sp.]
MAVETEQKGSVVARPTKSFFVHMLTRDIELQDALLDLLDNCVDGIVRSLGSDLPAENPYGNFQAVITMAPDHFIIEDNCGGIPIAVARKYAFAIGKPAGFEEYANHTTVGMYGIGMKRAIFKLGTEALVESKRDEGFVVEFSPEWMEEDSWNDLPMYDQKESSPIQNGTRIEVHELSQEAKTAFSDAVWVDGFRKSVSRHYALIIKKGFSVTIGSPAEIERGIPPVSPEEIRFLVTEIDDGKRIAPFVYKGECSGVDVEIYAGLYRKLLSSGDGELEEETRGSSDDAGWTISCNDRVVVWKDRTRLTGWGEATVPNYHGQFIAITGIVMLSGDPARLPLTTTKRGVDASSNLYSEVKDMMRDATKALTSFTNKWKKFPARLEDIYQGSNYIELSELRRTYGALATTVSRRYPGIKKYEPIYPVPVQESTSSRVSFVALKSEISFLSDYFFGDQKAGAGDVGLAAFQDTLKRVRSEVEQ